MIEMDDSLTYQLTGKAALSKKIESLLRTNTSDIPYYKIGLDAALFSYDDPTIAVRDALAPLGVVPSIDDVGRVRILTADINLDVTSILSEEQ